MPRLTSHRRGREFGLTCKASRPAAGTSNDNPQWRMTYRIGSRLILCLLADFANRITAYHIMSYKTSMAIGPGPGAGMLSGLR